MIPYIRSTGSNNIINCNCDLIIFAEYGTPLLISLVDIAIKNKKICSDLIENKYGGLYLKDREDISFEKSLHTYNGKFRFKSERVDNINTHTMIYNTEIDNYCIDWENEGFERVITKFLRNKYFLPVTEEIVSEVKKLHNEIKKHTYSSYGVFRECEVFTNNPIFKDVKCYSVNVSYFKEYLLKINIFNNESDFDWNTIEDIEDYLYTFSNPIKEKLKSNINILYNPKNINRYMFEGKYKPFMGQIPIIQSGIEVLKHCKGNQYVYLAGQQGVGKTLITSKVNHCYFKDKNKLNYCTLIVAPAITLTQWKEELINSISDKIDIVIIKKTIDFIKWYKQHCVNKKIIVDKPTYLIVGKETFKLSYKKIAGVNIKKKKIKRTVKDEYWYSRFGANSPSSYKEVVEIIKTAICPKCGLPLKNPLNKKEDIYFSSTDFEGSPKKSTYKCTNCNEVLWQGTYGKTMKTSIIDYIKRKNIHFDSIIQDEIHESGNSGSIIGNASRTLLQYTKKNILLSGTTNNGYASNLHNLFLGLMPRKLLKYNTIDIKDFVKEYGTLQAISKRKDGEYYRYGRSQIKESDFKEIEGINTQVFTKYMIENYVFSELDDLTKDYPELEYLKREYPYLNTDKKVLPPINEYYIPIAQIDDISHSTNQIFDRIEKANAFNAKMYEDSILKHYVNNPFSWDIIHVEGTENTSSQDIQPKNYDNKIILPKEEKLMELIKNEHSEGRKCWIYCDFNNGGDYMNGETLPDRLQRLLEEKGYKVFQLKPSVKTYDRKEVINKNKDKYDVFISNMKLVKVGINLQFCPTYIFYMPSYFVLEVSQASRRGMRANSTLENRIYHLYYENTIENKIMKRYERKMAESNAIVGKFDVVLEEDKDIRTMSKLANEINNKL